MQAGSGEIWLSIDNATEPAVSQIDMDYACRALKQYSTGFDDLLVHTIERPKCYEEAVYALRSSTVPLIQARAQVIVTARWAKNSTVPVLVPIPMLAVQI